MMPSKRLLSAAILLLLLVTAIIFLGVIIWWIQANRTNEYEYVEVREYEGTDLSSISQFRENSIKGPQYVDAENYTLTVTGLVNNELEITYDEVLDNYLSFKKVVTLNCVEGWKVTILWEGIAIKDLIADAGVNPNANTVIFYAYDGYSTSLPLDYIIDNNIMMAYKMNNVTLPPERGFPFQLVAESKWGYKWIKWITTIELSNDETYRGYWESRGWPNDADV
jgi:DMSO/TMAO reductase YedYZ molybdopterin-dependent catalytic subunit